VDFDDVVKCESVEEFNVFVVAYLDEKGFVGVQRHRVMWALFYRWRDRHEDI
jgi:hypothetical protein